jgi:hypothetical protein
MNIIPGSFSKGKDGDEDAYNGHADEEEDIPVPCLKSSVPDNGKTTFYF